MITGIPRRNISITGLYPLEVQTGTLGGYTWDTDPSTLRAQTLVYLICVNRTVSSRIPVLFM